MNKKETKLIAKGIMAQLINCVDLYAFDECDKLLSNEDRDNIIEEIKKERNKLLDFGNKNNIDINYFSVKEIVESVIKNK